jgi:predicted nuclease of predicted toxin-antitoxin system
LKLLLDEMLSPTIARALRARGHDVEAIKEHPDWEGLPDPGIVALARREHRAIVTTNLRDFRPFHVELVTPGGAGHLGFVFVPTTYRLTRTEVGRMVTALEAKLADYPVERDLANGETWI